MSQSREQTRPRALCTRGLVELAALETQLRAGRVATAPKKGQSTPLGSRDESCSALVLDETANVDPGLPTQPGLRHPVHLLHPYSLTTIHEAGAGGNRNIRVGPGPAPPFLNVTNPSHSKPLSELHFQLGRNGGQRQKVQILHALQRKCEGPLALSRVREEAARGCLPGETRGWGSAVASQSAPVARSGARRLISHVGRGRRNRPRRSRRRRSR